MTEWIVSFAGIFLGWGASVEYRLGQLMKMSKDIEQTAERVDQIYEHLLSRPTEERLRERRG